MYLTIEIEIIAEKFLIKFILKDCDKSAYNKNKFCITKF